MADEKKEDKSSGNLALDAVKAVINSPLADEIRPTVREAGLATNTLGMIINVVLGPFRLWGLRHSLSNRNAEALLRADADIELRQLLESRFQPLAAYCDEIPEENKRLPSLRETNDIIEGFALTDDTGEDDELRKMFARLLATAMDDREEKPHPSFAKIIGELAPREAVLFRECVDCGGRFGLAGYIRGEFTTINQSDRIPESEQSVVIKGFHSLVRQQLIVIKRVVEGSFHPKYRDIVEVTPFGESFYLATCGELPAKGLWDPRMSGYRPDDDPPIVTKEDIKKEVDALEKQLKREAQGMYGFPRGR